LNEKNLEDNKATELLTLMEKASIMMTPILKIFSHGVLGRYPW
jgi:hypothetical protein